MITSPFIPGIVVQQNFSHMIFEISVSLCIERIMMLYISYKLDFDPMYLCGKPNNNHRTVELEGNLLITESCAC